jgi:hypothetical protein
MVSKGRPTDLGVDLVKLIVHVVARMNVQEDVGVHYGHDRPIRNVAHAGAPPLLH